MNHRKILIVEDHKENAEAIAEFIRFAFPDWELTQCDKGADAVRHCIDDPADVMILDIALADEINGLDVIRRLWQEGLRSKPRIILITALGNRAFRGSRPGRPWLDQLSEEEQSLVCAFFEKPYGWHVFLNELAKAADVPAPDKIKLIPDNE